MKTKRTGFACWTFSMSTGLFLGFMSLSSQALAWGEVAHGILSTVGATITTNSKSFYQANLANFANLATVPDVVWKAGSNRSGESPTHWFQADYYFPSCSINDIETFPKNYSQAVSKYTQSIILEQGTAPWRVKQFYDLAVASLKAGDMNSAIQYLGVMSHYIGDMSQPLHDSENYDGPNGAHNGIHLFFESTNISANPSATVQSEVQSQAEALLADPSFTAQFSGDIMDALYHEVARALSYRDQIFQVDSSEGRSTKGAQDLLAIALSRMADGSATLALILDHAWSDAGVSSSAGTVTVAKPSWVTPDFTNESPWIVRSSSVNDITADDCGQ